MRHMFISTFQYLYVIAQVNELCNNIQIHTTKDHYDVSHNGKWFVKNFLVQFLAVLFEQIWICNLCGTSGEGRQNSRLHFEQRHQTGPRCPCGSAISVSHIQYSHMYYCYECSLCRVRLNSQMAIHQHLESVHKKQ